MNEISSTSDRVSKTIIKQLDIVHWLTLMHDTHQKKKKKIIKNNCPFILLCRD